MTSDVLLYVIAVCLFSIGGYPIFRLIQMERHERPNSREVERK